MLHPDSTCARAATTNLIVVLVLMTAVVLISGCSDVPDQSPVQQLCTSDEDCQSGPCVQGFCIEDEVMEDTSDGQTDPSDAGEDLCSDGSPRNACGGCISFEFDLGSECGSCGGGAWTCHRVDPDRLSCIGATKENSCGGCEDLEHEPDTPCGSCGGNEGSWTCVDDNQVACRGEGINSCGGCDALDEEPGDSCGTCGSLRCDPANNNALICDDQVNACGGCGTLDNNPDTSCGECGTGVYMCDGEDETICVGGEANLCGGCATLQDTPGDQCGDCGYFVCSPDGLSTLCQNADTNACGQCGVLANQPDTRCGTCGVWQCNYDGTGTRCEDDHPKNACGGCAYLDGQPGASCGDCGNGRWTCAPDGESVTCNNDSLNACGACSQISEQPGTSCGTCGTGSWVCAPDGDAVYCGGHTTNACGGCQQLDHQFGAACTSCQDGPCAYACDGPNALSCETAPPDGFARVSPGTFLMGSPWEELGRDPYAEAQRVTTLSRAFYIQKTPVTQRDWYLVFGVNPSCFQNPDYDSCDNWINNNPYAPVEQVNWYMALAYANALSKSEGLPECYDLDNDNCEGSLTERDQYGNLHYYCFDQIPVNAPDQDPYQCEGYRLPTEAEWEYAARAGTTTATFLGDWLSDYCEDPINSALHSLCPDHHRWRTSPVKTTPANDWGIYDMLGNVWEWVWDIFQPSYGGPATDPLGGDPEEWGDRAQRGGSFESHVEETRAAARRDFYPDAAYFDTGFRLVRTAP